MTSLEWTAWVVLIGYLSLALELHFFALPSEASTYQLFAPQRSDGEALRRAQARPPAEKLLVYLLPTALGVALFLVPPVAVFRPGVIEWLVPLPDLASPGTALVGVLGIVLGRGLTFLSVLQLRRMQAEPDEGARGLFRWSRNPGLVGMYAFYLGNACLFPCAVLFLGFVPYAWNMHRKVLLEESHLSRSRIPGYQEYLARVPRYLVGGKVR